MQPGSATPYHLKGVDLAKGTYVRVGATSRRADEHSLRELTLRGVSQTYDEQPCLDSPLDKDAVEVLCSEMNNRRQHSAYGREITPRNLENWGLIRNAGGVSVPTRALLLLTSNPYRFARIQCGQFKEMTRWSSSTGANTEAHSKPRSTKRRHSCSATFGSAHASRALSRRPLRDSSRGYSRGDRQRRCPPRPSGKFLRPSRAFRRPA